ncbi:hypothetical protein C8R46DRAFT_1122348 [Mycena filopes]|nr:hypothetical protein C8R46DRAFT_1122348 [Mycena filopes]
MAVERRVHWCCSVSLTASGSLAFPRQVSLYPPCRPRTQSSSPDPETAWSVGGPWPNLIGTAPSSLIRRRGGHSRRCASQRDQTLGKVSRSLPPPLLTPQTSSKASRFLSPPLLIASFQTVGGHSGPVD